MANFKLALAEQVHFAYLKDEMIGAIIYGEWGSGKSSYSIQVLREIYGEDNEKWKKYLVFKPEEFLRLIDSLVMTKPPVKVPLVVWDDAGLWLYALDWNDAKVKSVVKFFNVARTVLGGLIMTTPAIDMIVGKIPHIEGMRIGKVTKASGHSPDIRRLSLARNTFTKWGKRYTQDYLEDRFNVMLPDEIYAYYKPLRDSYAAEAYGLMRDAWAPYTSSKDYEGKKSPN